MKQQPSSVCCHHTITYCAVCLAIRQLPQYTIAKELIQYHNVMYQTVVSGQCSFIILAATAWNRLPSSSKKVLSIFQHDCIYEVPLRNIILRRPGITIKDVGVNGEGRLIKCGHLFTNNVTADWNIHICTQNMKI